jgi:hypothetical protein
MLLPIGSYHPARYIFIVHGPVTLHVICMYRERTLAEVKEAELNHRGNFFFLKLTLPIVSEMDIDFTFFGAVGIASGPSSWTACGGVRPTFNVTFSRLKHFFHMTRIV